MISSLNAGNTYLGKGEAESSILSCSTSTPKKLNKINGSLQPSKAE